MLPPDDLEVGQKVTVLSVPSKTYITPFAIFDKKVISAEMGVPFEIRAVNLPFVILKPICGGLSEPPVHIDTRFIKLQKLSDDYVREYKKQYSAYKKVVENEEDDILESYINKIQKT